MRNAFLTELRKVFERDKNTVLVTAGEYVSQFSDLTGQYFEDADVSAITDFSEHHHKVYVCGMLPYLIQRSNVVTIGTAEIGQVRIYPNLKVYSPSDTVSAKALVSEVHGDSSAVYLRLGRFSGYGVYPPDTPTKFIGKGFQVVRPGTNKVAVIIATGGSVHSALNVADWLKESRNLDFAVIDLFRLKPVNTEMLLPLLKTYRMLVTLEDGVLDCGLGSLVLEMLHDNSINCHAILRMGEGDTDTIATKIERWMTGG